MPLVVRSLLAELEKKAETYAKAKESRSAEAVSIASELADAISSQEFILPLKGDSLFSNGTTTFIYESNAAYPALFAFIAEVLHTRVPIEIRATKFGPGEIIVKSASKSEANAKLAESLQTLRELVHAKKSEIHARNSRS